MALSGRMDRPAAMDFEKTFAEGLKNGERCFVVDMQDLEYISSAGLRSLLSAKQQLQNIHGEVRLCNIGGLVKEVFVISGFESLFPEYRSLEDAVKFS